VPQIFNFGRKLNKLNKDFQTQLFPNSHYLLWGLLTELPGYKLCYEVNRLLSLALTWEVQPGTKGSNSMPETTSTAPTLFSDSNRAYNASSSVGEWYLDTHADADMEVFLTTGHRNLLPQAAKPFPFFLLVGYLSPNKPEAFSGWANILASHPPLRSVVDLSEHVPLNCILP